MTSRKVVIEATFELHITVDEGVEISEIMEKAQVAIEDSRVDVKDSEMLTCDVLDSK